MRKSIMVIMLIGMMSLIGGYIALTYKFPTIEFFQMNQAIDQQIIAAENKSNQSLETILNELHEEIQTIIDIGMNKEVVPEGDSLFEKYKEQYLLLQSYQNNIGGKLNHYLSRIDFDKMSNRRQKLPNELALIASDLEEWQSQKINHLCELHEEINHLLLVLESFEEMFYNDKASEVVRYYEELGEVLERISLLHQEYVTALTNYYSVKAVYYESIANKGVLDYILQK